MKYFFNDYFVLQYITLVFAQKLITVLSNLMVVKKLMLIIQSQSQHKNQLFELKQVYKLQLTESVNHTLVSIFNLENSRFSNPFNALAHILSGLTAYCFYLNKPAAYLPKLYTLMIV